MLRRVWQRAGMWQSPDAVLLRRCCQCIGPCAAASTRSVLSTRFGAASARAVASQSDAAEKTPRSPNQLNVLLSNQTPPTTFVATCRALRVIDETALLVTIDVRTWYVALQRRPEAQGERVAPELLGLIANCSCENASVPMWTDLFFTV
uniref:Uncharacterized protein n=1 Tax=Peronospora matthiolae TaxID=2874970 RepID=A0AAV1ULU1_9STRA